MIGRAEIQKVSLEELEEVISKAMSRVNVQKESELCQFIPGSEGRIHHFTFEKLKKRKPAELLKMVNEHILENDNPLRLASKPRAGLKGKRTAGIPLNRTQINQLLNVLKSSGSMIEGAEDLISALSPHQTLRQVQKLMLNMIREKKIDRTLWETYIKLVEEGLVA